MSAPPVVGRGSHANAVDPRADWDATVVIVEPAMNDEKDVLAHIAQIGAIHAQPSEHPPDERARIGKDMVEIQLGQGQELALGRSSLDPIGDGVRNL
jgi:hypothetical protein